MINAWMEEGEREKKKKMYHPGIDKKMCEPDISLYG